jgi:hypothetical protein
MKGSLDRKQSRSLIILEEAAAEAVEATDQEAKKGQ